jgi:hypothetical protein
MPPGRRVAACTLGALLGLATLIPTAALGSRMRAAGSGVEVIQEVHHDVSPPLASMPSGGAAVSSSARHEHPARPLATGRPGLRDGALQTTTGPRVATTAGLSFAGVGAGDYGFSPNAAPPDPNLSVGATQVVQWVNESFAVFDKATGALVHGPVAGNTLWSGFGGGCQTNNDGDPIVKYDRISGRWVLTQFSVSNAPYLQCIAVSTTSDATGTYNRYAFSFGATQFPDYPKLGVWPDAYYMTFNVFNNASTFAGAKLCALNRLAMVAGSAATMQCFQLTTSFGGVLPSDLDGATAPPSGSPNYMLNFGTNSLNEWKFHVDFATPTNTTLTGPANIPVATFTPACNGGVCISQPNTPNKLDSLGDRLMYRLAYRNTGSNQVLVVDQSVKAGGTRRNPVIGVRWYELHAPNASGGATVFQQGTYAPNSTSRWMGSIAMDKVGDIAVGYSVSSGSVFPSIRYTGRVPTDPLGTLEAENTIKTGGGSQTGSLHRWGDYTSMAIDPGNDCTFFYTNEYLKSSGSFSWSTWIASFKFPGCI